MCGRNDQFLGRVQFRPIAALEPALLPAVVDLENGVDSVLPAMLIEAGEIARED
jgi:hypothetical protein